MLFKASMDVLLFAGLAVAYAISTWDLLRQSRLPRARWETGTEVRRLVGSKTGLPILLRLRDPDGRVLAPNVSR
jgi:hypothetical protein